MTKVFEIDDFNAAEEQAISYLTHVARMQLLQRNVYPASRPELPAQLRDVLAKTEIGRLTAPEITPQGVEVYALCGKRQSESGPAKKEVRDEMFNEAFEIASKRYLKELRDQSMIEYR